jgi:hypothetical protein
VINPQGEISVPLSTFGGLSTELSPADIPEGGSPDNQDIAFTPGSASTRPGLHRIYATVPDPTPRIWHKSLRKLDGSTVNVFLHASGHLWIEDFDHTPGVFTNVMDVAAGSRCKAVPVGGKLYMAFNDGMHGTEIPRWFDGTKWGRVSQGGPCYNPTFSESIGPSSTLAAINLASSIPVISAVTANPQVFTERHWEYY